MTNDVSSTHIVIPDTQVKDGVPLEHLAWIGQYIVDKFAGEENVTIIHLGDHADMPSLSSYDEGKVSMEGRLYETDIAAANKGFDILNAPLIEYNTRKRAQGKKQWHPRRIILHGNHEHRIARVLELSKTAKYNVSLEHLNYAEHGWEVVPFLKPIVLDGVTYAHYFYNPMTGQSYSGMIDTRLKNLGISFTQGHQQLLLYGIRYHANGQPIHGLVAGACYLHDEEYKGAQGNAHWRGIIVKHEVADGAYDPMFVSLNYLCKRYEGVTLDEFMAKKF